MRTIIVAAAAGFIAGVYFGILLAAVCEIIVEEEKE